MTPVLARLLALLLLCGVWGLGGSGSARADGEPPPSTTVTGVLPEGEAFKPIWFSVCLDGGCYYDQEVDSSDGRFSISDVPTGVGYVMAVGYRTYYYRGSRKVFTRDEGYLRADGTVYQRVLDASDATPITVEAPGDLGVITVDIPAPRPPPEPPAPRREERELKRLTERFDEDLWEFGDRGRVLGPDGDGIFVYVQYRACGKGTWKNLLRETTTENALFDFNDTHKASVKRKYQLKRYKSTLPNGVQFGFFIPGSDDYKPYRSSGNSCYY